MPSAAPAQRARRRGTRREMVAHRLRGAARRCARGERSLPIHRRPLETLAILRAAACAAPAPPLRPGGPALALVSGGGETVTLDELRRGRDAAVLVFWSAGCPCVRRYQERVDALLDAWPAGRVRVLGVSSNAGEPFDEVLRAARERGVRLPIYRDEGGRVAEALGARSTPTIAVLDAAGELRFLGWLDNERLPGDPGHEPWLDRALQGLLDGRTRFSARTPTWGCVITRSLFAPAERPCCSTSDQK